MDTLAVFSSRLKRETSLLKNIKKYSSIFEFQTEIGTVVETDGENRKRLNQVQAGGNIVILADIFVSSTRWGKVY